MDLDRIIATARRDARRVGGAEIRAMCDEIERQREIVQAVTFYCDSESDPDQWLQDRGWIPKHWPGSGSPWNQARVSYQHAQHLPSGNTISGSQAVKFELDRLLESSK